MVNLFLFFVGSPPFFSLLAAKTNQKETLFSRFVLTHDGYVHLHLNVAVAPAVIQLAKSPSNPGFSHGHRLVESYEYGHDLCTITNSPAAEPREGELYIRHYNSIGMI